MEGLPGSWTYRPPADDGQVAACERVVGMRLPDDLRRFLLRSDGGDVWFTEEREPPGFFLSMLSARGIAELYRVRQGFSDALDLVPFASDGASEYFYVDRVSGSILMINTTGTRAEAAVCG